MKTVHTRIIVFLAAAGVTLAFAATDGIVAAQPTSPNHERHQTPSNAMSVEETAKARLAAAERVCKMLHDQETGVPRGLEGVEHTYLWSKRRMDAQIEVDRAMPGGGDGGLAAIERHAEWMLSWHEQVIKSGAFSRFEIASTEFYVAEAEDLLARAKGK